MKKTFLVFLLTLIGFVLFSQEICLTPLEKEVIELLNQKRVENGLSEVEISKVLMLTANKNVEEIVTQSYLNYKPEKFGDYTAGFEQIRYSSSASGADAIVKSLTAPTSYTKYHKIILNLDEFISHAWLGVGICIRSGNIVIIFGEKDEEKLDFNICSTEKFFEAVEVPQFPTLSVYVPQDAIVEIESQTYMGEIVEYEINTLSSFVDKGKLLNIPLELENVAGYYIYFSPQIPTIVPQEQIVFYVGADERGVIEKNLVFKGNSIDEITEYLNSGVGINSVLEGDPNEYTILHRAVYNNNIEAAELLLKKGADINIISADGENAVFFSFSDEMFNLLKSYNPNYNVITADNTSLLHSFALKGLLNPIIFLVEEKKLDVNATGRKGDNPLTFAVQYQNYDVAEYLLSKGSKQQMGWGDYPIHDAVSNGDLEMVKLLVKYGADVNAMNDSGESPLFKAKNHTVDNDDVIEYLISLGAK